MFRELLEKFLIMQPPDGIVEQPARSIGVFLYDPEVNQFLQLAGKWEPPIG